MKTITEKNESIHSSEEESSEWDEEDEEEYDPEWEAMMGNNKSEPVDSDDDTEYPIDFEKHEPFEPTEFEPDIIPMSYFAKIQISCASDPSNVEAVMSQMQRAAKIPYQGMGNVFCGTPIMGAAQGAKHMARYVLGYTTFVSMDAAELPIDDPNHGTFLAKLSSNMTLRANGKATRKFRKCLIDGDVKDFITDVKSQIIWGLDKKKIIACEERESCSFEIVGFQAVVMQWPENEDKLKNAEMKISESGMSECWLNEILGEHTDLVKKILRKVYLDTQEHIKMSMLQHSPFWA